MQAEQRQVILDLIQQLEDHGSTDGITEGLQRVAGDWRLLFSTIAITVRFGWPSHDTLIAWSLPCLHQCHAELTIVY